MFTVRYATSESSWFNSLRGKDRRGQPSLGDRPNWKICLGVARLKRAKGWVVGLPLRQLRLQLADAAL